MAGAGQDLEEAALGTAVFVADGRYLAKIWRGSSGRFLVKVWPSAWTAEAARGADRRALDACVSPARDFKDAVAAVDQLVADFEAALLGGATHLPIGGGSHG
jgi:hypothetical protein